MNYPLLRKTLERKITFIESEWEDFSNYWKTVTFKKNEYITQLEQIEPYFYFVLDGVQRLYFLNDGQEHVLGFSYHGDFSGMFDSFLHQTPSELYLQAITDSQMLAISFNDYNLLLKKYRKFEQWAYLFIMDILRGRLKREIEILSCSAEERYRNLLNRSPHVIQQIPYKHLASYLGMTPETFSRMRKKVAQEKN